MDNTFLQLFLKTSLFDIEDNDDRLKNLEDTISDLQVKFSEDVSIIPRYTLVAIDPNINENEPTLKEVEDLLIIYWKTLRSKYKEIPRNILRGVILNALYNEGINNSINARIIYLTATNYFPFAKLGNEKSIVEKLINDLGEIAEKDAVNEWSLIEHEPSVKIGVLKIADFKFGTAVLDKAILKADMKIAVANEPNHGHGPQHGGTGHWGEYFATKSSDAISKAFNNSINEFSKSLTPTSIEIPINKFFTDFKKSLDSSLKTSFSSLVAVERRSKLLWWKETLYSSSLKKSYRELDKNLLPIILSSDYYYELPSITPISADYLLKDVFHLLNIKNDQTVKFKDYLEEIIKEKEILKDYFDNSNESVGRIPVTDFFALLLNDRVSVKDFYDRTGVKEDEVISYSNLSVVILHDLLTQYLTSK